MNPIVAARKVLGIPNPEQEFIPLTRQDLAQGVRDLPRSVKETAKFIPQGLNKALSIVSPIETAVAGLIGEEGTPEERIASAFVNDTDLVTALQNRNVPGAMPIGLAAGLAIPGAGEAKSVGKFVDDLPEFRKMVQNYDQLPKKMQVQAQEAGRRILEALPIGNTRDLINKIGQTSPRQWLEEVSEQAAGYMEETAQRTSRQVDQMQKITPGANKAVENVKTISDTINLDALKKDTKTLQQLRSEGFTSISNKRGSIDLSDIQPSQRVDKPDVTITNDYGLKHRPTKTGALGSDITKDGKLIPKDVYTNPEFYANMKNPTYRESFNVIKSMQGKPNKTVTIYRASPVNQLNAGDWVTLSKKYAEEQADRVGGKVFSYDVKAKDIQFAGDDINEFGFYPE